MRRRDFLKTGGIASAAGIVLDGCGKPQQLIPLLVSEDQFIPGEEGWVRTLCHECAGGCGITVRLMQGESIRTIDGEQKRRKSIQAKKVEGNPEHPVSMGGTCARGQASLQALYHPDRIQTPLKRSGPRGSGQYEPTTWNEAHQFLLSQIQRQAATPRAVALMTGRSDRGTMGTILERFAAGIGGATVVSYDPFDPAPMRKAMELVTGVARLPAIDFGNANYLLSFNANLFETFLSPVHYIHAYGRFRQGRPGIRGKFVHAEPRLSQTAACADEWLPIKPGTEGLLSLAMAHVIVNEKLHDVDFVARRTTGFEEWSQSLGPYAPESVAPHIDVPAAAIERIAREFATRRPSVAVADSRDVASLTAVLALNALVGAFDQRGGILTGRDELAGPARTLGSPAANIHALSAALTAGEIQALLLFDTNPLFTLPEGDNLRLGFAKVPFIASFASVLDESSVMADLIVPSHHTFERWVDDIPEPGAGFPVRTIGPPVVEPRWDTRDPGDVLIGIAKALGGKAAEALPFDTTAAAIKESFRSVHAMQVSKAPAAPGSAGSDSGFDDFFAKVTAAGGWWGSPVSGQEAAPRIQFVTASTPIAARPLAGDATQLPFTLHIYPSVAFADGRTAHLPWLQEMPDPMTTVMWGSWVEINPQTAQQLDIREGDVLTISSPHGSIALPAFLYPGLRPDVIAIPAGQGHTAYGRYAAARGANPLRLCGSIFDEASGAVLLDRVRVNATKTGRNMPLIRFGASDARLHHEHEVHR